MEEKILKGKLAGNAADQVALEAAIATGDKNEIAKAIFAPAMREVAKALKNPEEFNVVHYLYD